jgi:hypothetical protein
MVANTGAVSSRSGETSARKGERHIGDGPGDGRYGDVVEAA